MMIKKFTIIFLLTLSSITFPQSKQFVATNINELPQEKIHIHSNNDFLLTGETLYYTVYCLDSKNTFSPYSKIAYFELINSENKKVIKQRVLLKSGTGYGDFFINTKIKTGSYKIIGYTQWMKNKQSFFQKNIFIVNPFSDKLRKDTTNVNINTLSNTPIKNTTNQKSVLFENKKSSYAKREKVKLNLTDTFSKTKGAFSISIRKKNNFELPNKVTFNPPQKSNTTLFLPELRGVLIHGKVTTSTTLNPIADIKLSLSTKDKDELPITAITNSKGEFYFNVPKLNTQKVYIQILDKNKEEYNIELIKNSKSIPKLKNFSKLFLNQNISKTINNRSMYSQIENAYYTVKKDSIISFNKKNTLLSNVEITYNLDDYKRFKTVKETFTEVVEGARFFRSKGQYKLNVINDGVTNSLNFLPTLLIVDGHIVQNHNDILYFDSRKINTISIVRKNYFYGNALYQGIVIIKTFKNNFFSNVANLKEFQVIPIQPEKIYFFQNSKGIKNKRIPDFRTQLFWNPQVNLAQNNITFFTSDVTGIFEIVIQGYTKEGKFINERQTFSVR